jgi:hypothetical protein
MSSIYCKLYTITIRRFFLSHAAPAAPALEASTKFHGDIARDRGSALAICKETGRLAPAREGIAISLPASCSASPRASAAFLLLLLFIIVPIQPYYYLRMTEPQQRQPQRRDPRLTPPQHFSSAVHSCFDL